MDVLDWIEKAKKFNTNDFLGDLSAIIIRSEDIIDLQRLQWDQEGIDYKGRVIGFYKKSTEEITRGRKKEGDPYDLQNTGDFWQNTFLMAIIKGNDIEFVYDSSGVNKSKLFETIQMHGEISNPDDIFGLYEPFKEQMIAFLQTIFIKQLNEYYNV